MPPPFPPPTIISPPQHSKFLLHTIGGLFLIANKLRHTFKNYSTPRTFSSADISRAITYDVDVVTAWLKHLHHYTHGRIDIKDKVILELGPGADLGVGLLLLSQGAKQYYAFDKNYLIKNTPLEFYKQLFSVIKDHPRLHTDISTLQKELELTLHKKNNRLNYIVEKNFNIDNISITPIDIIFSQAALEHIDNLPETLHGLNKYTKTGTIFLGEIDLQTHTRWIREHDPLNIYRFADSFYNLCHFSGSPNRLRPYEYKKILRNAGWKNVQIIPLKKIEPRYLTLVNPELNTKFQQAQNEMDILSCIIIATKE